MIEGEEEDSDDGDESSDEEEEATPKKVCNFAMALFFIGIQVCLP